ncbi:hypothetical protein GCM10008023_27050 [Sphingomonas glacialis]|uniref:ChrB N-terminal domain-containing protein n=1 Tax=Sphingomonas glacialis TaxID=658225 RepID=A0ABQ3LN31_9SPHN|nr:hypothetical protein GCM10008023_27050 [Sphingomonas glacialis]
MGAIGIVNGAWALPYSQIHADLFGKAASKVREQGGRAAIFTADPLDLNETEALVAQSRADRGREYDEFAERADMLIAEIEKETKKRKFTFAELEEIEHDLEKLIEWLAKIEPRDFFPDRRIAQAKAHLAKCAAALKVFSEQVFVYEGVTQR